jgi:Carboxypeptidase regulatory-like domain
MNYLRTIRLCALTLAIAVPALFAQFEAATVLGTIRDTSGAVVPNCKVTLENAGTGIAVSTRTDGLGNYEFVNQHLGTYKVRAEAAGFQTAEASSFELKTNARQRVDLALKVGQASAEVTVSDAASLLETETSSRGQVIGQAQIRELPLNGRAYADLTLLSPGVAKSALENQADSSRDASFNVNGQRSELNNFMLDGVDNNSYGTSNQGFSNQVIQANPDSLAEFKIESNNYSAEFGRAAGAVISASIKSGTNQFHGEGWEFLRNTVLNAQGFFRPVAGGKLPYNQNQFGGAFGGPIVKDKLFFFADYEGFRRVSHPIQFATLPTPAMTSGDFSAYGVPIENPITGTIYSNGVIPQSAFTPLGSAVLSALPAPNLPGNSNNYESSPADTVSNNKGDFRADYYLSQHLTFFARYSQAETNIFNPDSIPNPVSTSNNNGNVGVRNKQAVAGATWTINPTSVLEVRLGAAYTIAGKTPPTLGLNTPQFNIPGEPTDPSLAGGLFSVGLNGGLTAWGRSSSNPQFQDPFVGDPKVVFTKIKGRHSIKTGFEFQFIDTAVNDFHPQYGTENYTGSFSDPAYFTNPSALNSLSSVQKQVYSVADFIFGADNHYELDNNPVAHLRQRMYFTYVQDDWKVNNKLTLNLGLRYEFATPQYERDNHLSNFLPSASALIYASGGSLYQRALVHPDKHNLAPRLGLAYQVTPKTVIRSGYGISYVQFNRLGGENLLAYNGPSIVDAFIDQVPTQGICSSANTAAGSCFRTTPQGFPANFASPSFFNPLNTQVRYIPENERTPYVQSWHFTIQREIAKDLVLDLGYVGVHSVGLIILGDENQALPNALGQNLSVAARRPYQNFNTIEISWNGGFGTYNALQAKLERRFHNGLYLLNSFTWSKAIDNAPGHLENYDGDNSRGNFYNLPADKGLSSYNQPLNDTLSVLYDLPFGKSRRFKPGNSVLDAVAGGWGLNVINTMTSGLPLNVTYGATTQASVSSLTTPRPNLTGVSFYLATGNPIYYLNPAAFSVPSYTQPWGTAARNMVRAPAFYNLDFGLHKNFAILSEARYLQFRAEAFNLLNKTNFSPPGTLSANSSGFGVFSSSFPARQVQLALKLIF